MLDSYTLSVLLSVNTSGSFSALLGEEGNIQKGPTDSGPAETEVEVRAGSSAFDRDCPGQVGTTCRKKSCRAVLSAEVLQYSLREEPQKIIWVLHYWVPPVFTAKAQ